MKYLILALLALAAIAHGQTSESITAKPLIAGSAVDAAADFIPVIDGSVTAGQPALKRLTIDELVDVPGLFASVPNGTFSIAKVSGLQAALDGKQASLVSGTNLKTINGTSLLGSGNLSVVSDLTGGPVTSSGGTSVIADGALSIAKTSGLQTALDGKLAPSAIATGTITPKTGDLNFNALGGGGTWGSITGTLFSQTDLQKELDKSLGGLGFFYDKLADRMQSGSFSFNIGMFGDSYAVAPVEQLESKYGKLGRFIVLPYGTLGSGAALGPTDFTRSPSGNYVDLGLNQTISTGSDGSVSGAKIKVLYNVDPAYGAFKIQHRRVDLGSFTDALTVDGAVSVNGATSAAMASVDVTPGTYEIRVIGNTSGKVVRIIGLGMDCGPISSLAERSGVTTIFSDIGGSSIAMWNQTPQHIWNALFGGANGIAPDVLFYKADDSAAAWSADFPSLVSKVQTAAPNTAIVVVGRHPTAAVPEGGVLNSEDLALRSLCETNGWLYVPSRLHFPSATVMEAADLLRPAGDVHLRPNGTLLQKQIIMQYLWPLADNMIDATQGVTGDNKHFMGPVSGFKYPDSYAPNLFLESDLDQRGGFLGWRSIGGAGSNAINPGYRTGFITNARVAGSDTHKGMMSVLMADWYRMTMTSGGNIFLGSGYQPNTLTNTLPAKLTVLYGENSSTSGVILSAVTSPNASSYPLQVRKTASYNADGTQVMRMSHTGKLNYLGGQADSVTGTFTLASGVATINTTSAATNDHVNVTINTPGGTMGTHYKVTISNGASLTITAIDNSGATVTTDTSSGTWEIAKGRF